MACDPPLLASTTPTAVAPADVFIGHIQLRDLVICPRERGILNYAHEYSIVEHDLNTNDSPRTLARLSFTPNTLAALPLNSHDTLLAAGGQEAEIHISCHTSKSRRSKLTWQYEQRMQGSINNSVFLTSLSLTRSSQSAVEPRLGISNNDCTVRLYEVPIRIQSQKRNIKPIGSLKLDVPINYSSISPDGRTLLSVGDSSKIYFHYMHGGDQVTFEHIHNLLLPPPDSSPIPYPSSLAASFSTAFSSDGMKFAVASQEGVLAVWDVRSTKPLKVIQTDKTRGISSDDGYLSDDPTEWTRGRSKAPGFSVRSVKFGGGGVSGKEVMTFTEHTSLLHVIDARTFETEEILKVPTVRRPEQQESQLPTPASSPPRPHDRRMTNHRNVLSSFTAVPRPPVTRPPSSPPNRRLSNSAMIQPQIIQALGDTFRISSPTYSPPSSISDSTWRTLRLSHVRNAREGDDYEEILVIPSLGDRNLESEVHALLNARTGASGDYEEEEGEDPSTGSNHADYDYHPPGLRPGNRLARQENDMDVDELESDCVSSRGPSRTGSPTPTHSQDRSPPGLGVSGPRSGTRTNKPFPTEFGYRDDLDIAGTCFDPTGGYIYVASKESVVEWSLRDADKTWWLDQSWR